MSTKLILGINFVCIAFFIISFSSKQQQIGNGVVGDVKYSVLAPEEFKLVNGPGWRLMDGKALEANWDLAKLIMARSDKRDDNNPYQLMLKNLPDARNMFIRGLNENRKDSLSNKGINKDDMEQIARIQFEATKLPTIPFVTDISGKHTHLDPTWNGKYGKFEVPTSEDAQGKASYSGSKYQHDYLDAAPTSEAGNHSHSIVSGGDIETRPVNIGLYIYIKVNE